MGNSRDIGGNVHGVLFQFCMIKYGLLLNNSLSELQAQNLSLDDDDGFGHAKAISVIETDFKGASGM